MYEGITRHAESTTWERRLCSDCSKEIVPGEPHIVIETDYSEHSNGGISVTMLGCIIFRCYECDKKWMMEGVPL